VIGMLDNALVLLSKQLRSPARGRVA